MPALQNSFSILDSTRHLAKKTGGFVAQWCGFFQSEHLPVHGIRWYSWLAQTHSIESGWGAWCWLWNFTRLKSAWGELTVTTQEALKIKNLLPHASEKRAFEEFGCPQETVGGSAMEPGQVVKREGSILCGIREDVSRLDPFLAASAMVADHGNGSYLSYERRIDCQGVGSALETAGPGN